ncbi:MAG: Acyl-ACP [Geobacteraceae bacterium]|nr:MAG: Acyl-ACP [Geobacteraceae bacterium]
MPNERFTIHYSRKIRKIDPRSGFKYSRKATANAYVQALGEGEEQDRNRRPMEPIYEKIFPIRSYEVDAHGLVRPTAVLNYLQEAAGDHAKLLGISVRDLMAQGLTWVLSRTHLKLLGTAHSREEMRVRTWPSTREGRFSCREFEVTATDGRPIAFATSSFAVLDLAIRRPVAIDEHLPAYPLLPSRALADDFATLPRLSVPEMELTFRVGRGDLDINRHANNVVYVDWALETVPAAVAEGCLLADLEIAYRAEVFYGETVLARSQELAGGKEPVFLHQLVRREDGAELTRLVTRWREYTKQDERTGNILTTGKRRKKS